MKIEQKPTFRKAYKKLHNNQKKSVNQAILAIIDNPQIGTRKKGGLRDVFIYKFNCINQPFFTRLSMA